MPAVEPSPLTRRIAQQISDAGGTIGFDQWMAQALYDPDHGYYEGRQRFADPVGKQEDFVTAADLGPWASLAFADLILWSWQQLGSPAVWALVEQGGGSGRLLVDTLAILAGWEMAQPQVYAVERSASLRQHQRTLYDAKSVAITQCATTDQLPDLDAAVLMSNELPDAFPVRRFVAKNSLLYEQMVAWDGSKFIWQDATAPLPHPPNIATTIRTQWQDNYRSEWNPNLDQWIQSCSEIANKSIILCVDYGFSQQEYYRPERSDGTLMGHQQHQVVEHILAEAGACDITAHIDFTALLHAACTAGFHGTAFMPQWAWLAQSPSVQREMANKGAQSDLASVQAIAQAKRLMLPQGMGETFKLLVAAKGVTPTEPSYLAPFNRLSSLQDHITHKEKIS